VKWLYKIVRLNPGSYLEVVEMDFEDSGDEEDVLFLRDS
jgi:hypothetical protein